MPVLLFDVCGEVMGFELEHPVAWLSVWAVEVVWWFGDSSRWQAAPLAHVVG